MLLPRLQNIPPPPRLAALVLIAAVGARLLLREEEGPRWVRGLMSPDMVHAAERCEHENWSEREVNKKDISVGRRGNSILVYVGIKYVLCGRCSLLDGSCRL